ncbi:hypothetical protein N7509_004923 [Penicillium cosmopolitanum]|uniref:Uncharacterized protein n=1 Tax=Penicillium cosmopolitanum TaxID=1131564 RepID=A0A9X0B9K1_9EURO|nr:uncharacterized protein N7509_004923 [Penicillium cosmopolitanum]KAJ5396810.1 hypothetical protein N7509_004923 [Penicillium cosmopolitanum]
MVWDNPNGQQIGWGVYLSTGPGEWKGYEWNCAIWADLDKWEAAPKAWIPEEDECGNSLLQPKSEFARNKYVESLGLDPEKTVFISPVYDHHDPVYQVLVKPNMLKGKANDMGIGATCAKKTVSPDGETENLHLDVTVPADWRSWVIEGRPEDL